MRGSTFALPAAELPSDLAATLPRGTTPITLAGHALVSVAFVHYEPGSVLAYDELLVAVGTRACLRPRVTLPHIWVSTEAARDGGRDLWAIPKGLARFSRSGDRTAAEGIASLHARPGPRLRPGWQVSPLTTAQHLDGSDVVATNVMRARPRALRGARWEFAPDGPLAYLAARRPLVNIALTDMAITFGIKTVRS